MRQRELGRPRWRWQYNTKTKNGCVIEEVAYKKRERYTKATVETDVTMHLREIIPMAVLSKA